MGWIYDNVDITGVFGVGRKMRGTWMGNTYIKNKSLYKYTKVASGQDGMGVMNLIGYVLV